MSSHGQAGTWQPAHAAQAWSDAAAKQRTLIIPFGRGHNGHAGGAGRAQASARRLVNGVQNGVPEIPRKARLTCLIGRRVHAPGHPARRGDQPRRTPARGRCRPRREPATPPTRPRPSPAPLPGGITVPRPSRGRHRCPAALATEGEYLGNARALERQQIADSALPVMVNFHAAERRRIAGSGVISRAAGAGARRGRYGGLECQFRRVYAFGGPDHCWGRGRGKGRFCRVSRSWRRLKNISWRAWMPVISMVAGAHGTLALTELS